MERKYYLRGLGLGIAVTAIIMSVALSGRRTMTNDEIIARAKELGLVENTVLSNAGNADDSQENIVDDRADAKDLPGQSLDDLPEVSSAIDAELETEDTAAEDDGDITDEAEGETALKTDGEEQVDADSGNAAEEEDPEPEDVVEEEPKDTTVPEENNTGTKNVHETISSGTVKVITIKSGDSSYTVAKKLADVGVVTSAQKFDTFLCQNGYDKRLRTGNFSIPADASDEQIARIVTGLE